MEPEEFHDILEKGSNKSPLPKMLFAHQNHQYFWTRGGGLQKGKFIPLINIKITTKSNLYEFNVGHFKVWSGGADSRFGGKI